MSNATPRSPFQIPNVLRYLSRWTPIAALVGIFAGSASALLLWSLAAATAIRERHHWLIALLPLAGLAVGCLYHYFGRSVEAGNNLILDEIHDPHETIPLRMAPLVLLGTFLTHLFVALPVAKARPSRPAPRLRTSSQSPSASRANLAASC